jgi:hypothetical protein
MQAADVAIAFEEQGVKSLRDGGPRPMKAIRVSMP